MKICFGNVCNLPDKLSLKLSAQGVEVYKIIRFSVLMFFFECGHSFNG